MAWTLEIAGVERSFADLGIEEKSTILKRRNAVASVLRIYKPGAMDGALLAAYDAAVIFRRDRAGAGTAWAGGGLYFTGYADLPTRTGSGTAEAISYEFRDWWTKAEKCIYHQYWHRVTSINPDKSKVYTNTLTPNVFLGVALDGTRWTNGQQITDALNWLIGVAGAIIQVGTIEPTVNIFSTEARSISVAEVLRTMLAHSPDAQIITDYTTTPPTVHVKKNTSLTNVTLTAGTDPITELSLTPKHDLQVPVVIIHLKQTTTLDGAPYPSWGKQIYPPNPGPGTDLAWETQIGAVITTLELEGSQTTYAKGSILTAAIAANHGTLANRIAWWKTKEKAIAGANIDPASISIAVPFEVKDATGATINLATYPYELQDGTVADWMPVEWVRRVTIKAKASYTLYQMDVAQWQADHPAQPLPEKLIVKKAVDREIHCEIDVCDYDTGGEVEYFKTKATFMAGEPEPAGLAQSYYESLATLYYQGTITDVNNELPDQNLLGCKLTIAGTAVAIANQLIQEVTENLGTGVRSITIGPPAVLDIESLMDLHRVCRNRRVWNNPALKVTGDPGSDNGLDLGGTTARQDTTSGNGTLDIAATASTGSTGLDAGEKTVIKHDAINQLTVYQVVKADGTEKTSAGKILLALSAALGLTIQIREWKVTMADCSTKYALILSSEPYDTPKTETPLG